MASTPFAQPSFAAYPLCVKFLDSNAFAYSIRWAHMELKERANG